MGTGGGKKAHKPLMFLYLANIVPQDAFGQSKGFSLQ